ncbi:PREDICTED: uncharacterized protein LOC108755188 isoform X3 [Trachymyrmex septentrionalis]|uniref:uncharacterized protein LOC108755188 isoform X3 n=1 Tax=Trachymyrmex septentrionalis TaxID=34720 RepID=UPI00084EEC12|nr:PREDICTED: uncharacterized protein LOC108755188 isoform X3 [Trachymyrmex septentrionalis]
MGNYANKLLFYTNESEKECNEHQMVVQQVTMEDNNICTPILSEKRVLGDPRSVSAGIRRTPIEIKYTSSGENKKTPSAMSKYLQKKQYLETDMYVVMPPLTPKKRHISKSMDSDKQSDFIEVQDLTPNVNVAKSSKIITPIDKERFIILGLDPRSPAADFDRTPILIPKSLALIKARSQENLSRKASESLKALDTEKKDGLSITSLYNFNLNISKSEKEITVIRNPKYISEEKRSLVSDKQIVAIDNEEDKNETEKQNDCENIESNTKTRDDDKIKLWHDSLSLEKSVSDKKDEKELSRKKVSRDDVIITFDKYTTISTSLKPMKTDFRKKEDTKGKKKNTKVNIKLNEEKLFSLENKQEIEMYENRIPLGNRSNNNQIQKKPQQLLRNKTASIGTQENTPPSKAYSRKTRNGTQWDPNSTVLI